MTSLRTPPASLNKNVAAYSQQLDHGSKRKSSPASASKKGSLLVDAALQGAQKKSSASATKANKAKQKDVSSSSTCSNFEFDVLVTSRIRSRLKTTDIAATFSSSQIQQGDACQEKENVFPTSSSSSSFSSFVSVSSHRTGSKVSRLCNTKGEKGKQGSSFKVFNDDEREKSPRDKIGALNGSENVREIVPFVVPALINKKILERTTTTTQATSRSAILGLNQNILVSTSSLTSANQMATSKASLSCRNTQKGNFVSKQGQQQQQQDAATLSVSKTQDSAEERFYQIQNTVLKEKQQSKKKSIFSQVNDVLCSLLPPAQYESGSLTLASNETGPLTTSTMTTVSTLPFTSPTTPITTSSSSSSMRSAPLPSWVEEQVDLMRLQHADEDKTKNRKAHSSLSINVVNKAETARKRGNMERNSFSSTPDATKQSLTKLTQKDNLGDLGQVAQSSKSAHAHKICLCMSAEMAKKASQVALEACRKATLSSTKQNAQRMSFSPTQLASEFYDDESTQEDNVPLCISTEAAKEALKAPTEARRNTATATSLLISRTSKTASPPLTAFYTRGVSYTEEKAEAKHETPVATSNSPVFACPSSVLVPPSPSAFPVLQQKTKQLKVSASFVANKTPSNSFLPLTNRISTASGRLNRSSITTTLTSIPSSRATSPVPAAAIAIAIATATAIATKTTTTEAMLALSSRKQKSSSQKETALRMASDSKQSSIHRISSSKNGMRSHREESLELATRNAIKYQSANRISVRGLCLGLPELPDSRRKSFHKRIAAGESKTMVAEKISTRMPRRQKRSQHKEAPAKKPVSATAKATTAVTAKATTTVACSQSATFPNTQQRRVSSKMTQNSAVPATIVKKRLIHTFEREARSSNDSSDRIADVLMSDKQQKIKGVVNKTLEERADNGRFKTPFPGLTKKKSSSSSVLLSPISKANNLSSLSDVTFGNPLTDIRKEAEEKKEDIGSLPDLNLNESNSVEENKTELNQACQGMKRKNDIDVGAQQQNRDHSSALCSFVVDIAPSKNEENVREPSFKKVKRRASIIATPIDFALDRTVFLSPISTIRKTTKASAAETLKENVVAGKVVASSLLSPTVPLKLDSRKQEWPRTTCLKGTYSKQTMDQKKDQEEQPQSVTLSVPEACRRIYHRIEKEQEADDVAERSKRKQLELSKDRLCETEDANKKAFRTTVQTMTRLAEKEDMEEEKECRAATQRVYGKQWRFKYGTDETNIRDDIIVSKQLKTPQMKMNTNTECHTQDEQKQLLLNQAYTKDVAEKTYQQRGLFADQSTFRVCLKSLRLTLQLKIN